MSKAPWRYPVLVLALAGLISCVASAYLNAPRTEAVSQEGESSTKATLVYFPNSNCKPCHTNGPLAGFEDLKPLQCRCDEVSRWEQHDKHQFAYTNLLKEERAKQMGRLLKIDVATDTRCLSCHAVVIKDEKARQESKKFKFALDEGVSCVVCHGPYKEWIVEHGVPALAGIYREMKRPDKEVEKGMTDLWDPVKRTKLCASCHVGDRQADPPKFVTHEMYAAGHPPLPGFEISTFSDQMPRHWEYLANKDPKVGKRLDYDGHAERAHLILVGTAVAFRESMKLLEAEAAECAQADGGRMLDLVHFDCYACHHDLRAPSWRQERGYAGKPGRPQPRPWPVSPLRLLLHYLAANEADAKAQEKALQERMAELHAAFDARPFGDPAVVRRVLRKTVLPWSQNLVDLAAKKKPSKADAGRLAALVPLLFKDRLLDYDEARQVAWIFKTLHDEAHGPPAGAMKEAMDAVEKILRLNLPAGKERSIEKELDQNLKALNDYKPREFQKALAVLGAALAKLRK